MRILTRYIIRTVIASTSLVVLVLLGIESFMGLVDELGDIGTGNYDILHALLYVGMQLPFDLYQLFPIAGFIGCLLGLGQLAQSSELTVMRAAGVSITRIIAAVMLAALMMLIIATTIGETLSPAWQYRSGQEKQRLMNPQQPQEVISSVWLHRRYSFVYIDQIINLRELKGVTLFEFAPDNQLLRIRVAKRAVLQHQQHWVLQDVTVTEFQHFLPYDQLLPPSQAILHSQQLASQVVVTTQPTALLGFAFNPQLMQRRMQIDPDRQTLPELIANIKFRHQAGLLAYNLEFSLWQRLVQPVTTLVMICLGAPFIFGSLRTVSVGERMLTGIVVGFCFYMINHFLGPIALVHAWPAWIAAIAPTILFAGIFWIMLQRVR